MSRTRQASFLRLSGHAAAIAALLLSATSAGAQVREVTAAAATAKTVAARTVAAGPRTGEYRINAGDELEVFVWGEERMQRPVRVLPDGTFAFPLAGIVEAEGHTSREIAELLRQRLKAQYRNTVPDVTVAVRDPAGMRFYVVGKVRSPGSYPIGRTINVVQALSVAGGPAEFADVGDAVIMRQTASGQTVERINLSDVLRGGRSLKSGPQSVPLPMLSAGDVLVIP